MAQLPLEIWALIIDHLADDRHAISVCSLVENRWVPLARKHLFETLIFDADGPQKAESLLNGLALDFAVIAPYVRTLTFIYDNVHERDIYALSREYAVYLKQLAAALGSRVETLHLCRVVVSEIPDFIPTEGFPRLRHLHFEQAIFQLMDLMAAYVASFPLLRSFALNDCDFDSPGIRSKFTLPPLHELELSVSDYLENILSWVSRSGLASTLRRLKVLETTSSDHEAIASFLSTFTPCLSSVIIALDLERQPSETYVWPLITSNSMASLEITCHMNDVMAMGHDEYGDAVEPLARILENLRAPALETIILGVDMGTDYLRPVVHPRDDDGASFPLDHMPSLKRLSVFFLRWWIEQNTLEDRIRACASMPIFVAAREKGMLRAYFLPESSSVDHNEPDPEMYFDGLTYQRG